jgi:two-component system chemotaxis response regulator CheB
MEPRSLIRTLIVDDSAVMRALLRSTLAAAPAIELVGMASDGLAGLEAIERLQPDLVLLDIEMPRLNGLEVLSEMRSRNPSAKVIMCSTLTRRGAGITLEALARGATDYVAKPTAQLGAREGIETLRRELLPKIDALFSISAGRVQPALPRAPMLAAQPPGIVVIGVSTGGPAALEKLLPALSADFPLPIMIVQHMPPLFTALLAERLDSLCALSVREAHTAEIPKPGVAYLARGDWHMQLVGSPGCFSMRLTQSAVDELCRPSVDILFRSAASVFGGSVLAIMLTGMGSDGLAGCRAIHAAGGRILVQDRKTSAVWGMPGVVAEAGLADQVLPLEAIAAETIRSTMFLAGSKPA